MACQVYLSFLQMLDLLLWSSWMKCIIREHRVSYPTLEMRIGRVEAVTILEPLLNDKERSNRSRLTSHYIHCIRTLNILRFISSSYSDSRNHTKNYSFDDFAFMNWVPALFSPMSSYQYSYTCEILPFLLL